MESKAKKILSDKLIELGLISKESEIQEHSFAELEEVAKGIEINEKTSEQMSKYLFGIHQKDRFETVIYYRFLIAENFSRLIADIDKHSEYNLSEYYLRTNHVFDTFYRIELAAKFINFVESLSAIYTVTQEWKKSFNDKEFEESLDELVGSLSLNFSILKKIRNKLHHAYYVRIIKGEITSASQNTKLIAFDRNELLRKVDDLTIGEIAVIDKYTNSSFVNIKPLIVDCFQEYSTFLLKYQTLVENLLQRLTGTKFNMTI